ncbi:hypothetical protein QTP88_000793 [Uroleucon formosanum]
MTNAPPNVEHFTDYIVDTFIDVNSLFPPYVWAGEPSMDPRTTNGPEAFHRDFNSQFYTCYPNCFAIVNILLEVQEESYLKIGSIKRNVQNKKRKEDMDNITYLQFEFMVKPSNDGKSNLITVTSITTEAKETYAIPEELQQMGFHKEVSTTTIYNMVKSSLKKRHQFRKVWIPLTEELKKVYMDDYDNMLFAGQCLEEITSKHANTVIQEEKDNLNALNLNTLKLLETLVGNAQIPKDQNLKNISEKFVLEKFTSKNLNAKHWINNFEKECIRFDVNEDYKKN